MHRHQRTAWAWIAAWVLGGAAPVEAGPKLLRLEHHPLVPASAMEARDGRAILLAEQERPQVLRGQNGSSQSCSGFDGEDCECNAPAPVEGGSTPGACATDADESTPSAPEDAVDSDWSGDEDVDEGTDDSRDPDDEDAADEPEFG